MEASLIALVNGFLEIFALPKIGLSAIFIVSLISATLLPLGSEPAVFGYVKLVPDMFWPAILVATLGNTLGGIISYLMGWGVQRTVKHWQHKHAHPSSAPHAFSLKDRWHQLAHAGASRLGPAALLFSWLPIVGDPLCAVAGWLHLSFWRCAIYMSIGKFLRYLVLTSGLIWLFPQR